MYNFKKEELLKDYAKAYAQYPEIERIAEELSKRSISEIYMLGCGGAFTKFMSVKDYLHQYLHIPVIVEDPIQFEAVHMDTLHEEALVMMGTKTGTTEEILKVAKAAKEKGIRILGFVGDADTPFEEYLEYKLCSVCTDVHIIVLALLVVKYLELKGFSVDYRKFRDELAYFGDDLVAAVEANLENGKRHVELAVKKDFQLWVASGNLWGETNCYVKYMMEEVQWKKAQAVHAGEFFHGPLELIEPELCVNVVVGHGPTRKMDERVASFVKTYGRDYTIIDMNDFKLPHMSEEYLELVYPYVLNIFYDQLADIYKPITKMTMDTRRYYRKVAY